MGLTLDRKNKKKIIVHHAIEGMPGQIAGLQSGDEIVSINYIELKQPSHESICALFEFGSSRTLPLEFRRRPGIGVYSQVHKVTLLEQSPNRHNDSLFAGFGVVLVEKDNSVVVQHVSKLHAAGNVILPGDIVQTIEECRFLKVGDVDKISHLLSKPSLCFTVTRNSKKITANVARKRSPQEASIVVIHCVGFTDGLTLAVSRGRVSITDIDGRLETVSRGVTRHWELLEVNSIAIDGLHLAQIEAMLVSPCLSMSFQKDKMVKRLVLFRNDLSHAQLVQKVAPELTVTISSPEKKGWFHWPWGSRDDHTFTFSAKFSSLMGCHNKDFAQLIVFIDQLQNEISQMKGDTALNHIEAAAGIVQQQIAKVETVHLLAQFYLVLKLFSYDHSRPF